MKLIDPIQSAADDEDSPRPYQASGASHLRPVHYDQYSDSPRTPLSALHTSETEETSQTPDERSTSGPSASTYNVGSFVEDFTYDAHATDTGFLGHICEVQWLRSLKYRVQPSSVASTPTLSDTNFYLDNQGVRLPEPGNPFFLPNENLSRLLLQCFSKTVYNSFPMIPKTFEDQLRIYYHSAQNEHSITFPPRWYATVNVVLAIGARFLRLTGSELPISTLDETIYIARAYQLLGLDETGIVLAPPDLPLIQVQVTLSP
jgi:hypothetical protein